MKTNKSIETTLTVISTSYFNVTCESFEKMHEQVAVISKSLLEIAEIKKLKSRIEMYNRPLSLFKRVLSFFNDVEAFEAQSITLSFHLNCLILDQFNGVYSVEVLRFICLSLLNELNILPSEENIDVLYRFLIHHA